MTVAADVANITVSDAATGIGTRLCDVGGSVAQNGYATFPLTALFDAPASGARTFQVAMHVAFAQGSMQVQRGNYDVRDVGPSAPGTGVPLASMVPASTWNTAWGLLPGGLDQLQRNVNGVGTTPVDMYVTGGLQRARHRRS